MKTPNPKIEGLVSGILKPIVVNTPFDEKLVGLNCFGFGGVNVHVIVRSDSSDPYPQNQDIFGGIPRLVLMCGRTEEALNSSLSKVMKTPKMLTRDYLSLLNDISKTSAFKNGKNSLRGMPFRGFALIDSKDVLSEESNQITFCKSPEARPQVWYVFSGMGGQWPAMAKSLMSLKVFEQSIRRSAQVLIEYEFDLMHVLLDINENLMDCPLNSFVGLAAIQIALVDVLRELDVSPDGIVGHSVGELVCAYADGCVTHEETIRMAFWRGKCVKDDLKCRGRMAAIGLSLEEVRARLPTGVFIACHNSEDSITVSGKEEAVHKFVQQLKSESVFARLIDSSGIAFHSPLMSGVRQILSEKLSQIIPNKRLKSSKWLSTTYDESDERSHYVCSEYFVDNLIQPVLFSPALSRIPRDAVVIEVSIESFLSTVF